MVYSKRKEFAPMRSKRADPVRQSYFDIDYFSKVSTELWPSDSTLVGSGAGWNLENAADRSSIVFLHFYIQLILSGIDTLTGETTPSKLLVPI